MTRSDTQLFAEGLSTAFVSELKTRIESHVLPGAEEYFAPGGTAYSQNSPDLKRAEMAVNYFDYQPCSVSVLAILASRGDRRAEMLVRRIFDNANYYLDEWRSREGIATSLRRSQLHLVLAYETLHEPVGRETAQRWRALILRSAQDMLDHFNHFQELCPSLDNRAFNTGINHVAIAAEGIWRTGHVFGESELCDKAGGFIDRLVDYGHEDGYFEEHTNDEREGGPSLVYTPLTAGCAYIVQKWRAKANPDRFAACGALFRNFCDGRFLAMPFADERANPQGLGPYGIALHALSAKGRGFLRKALDPETSPETTSGGRLEYLSRLYFEIEQSETGPGETPEPCETGNFRIGLPIGVRRSGRWHAGVSGLRALNRVISPDGDYALDRQTLVFLSHNEAGTLISGIKSKRNPDWSTLRIGDDAYPVRTGDLSNDMTVRVHYDGFSADLAWDLGEEARLKIEAHGDEEITAQLVLEIQQECEVALNGHEIDLTDKPYRKADIQRIATPNWEVTAECAGEFDWFVAPFNPYSEGNRSNPETRRPVYKVKFKGATTFTFTALS